MAVVTSNSGNHASTRQGQPIGSNLTHGQMLTLLIGVALNIRFSDSDGPRGHRMRPSVPRVGHISRQFHRTDLLTHNGSSFTARYALQEPSPRARDETVKNMSGWHVLRFTGVVSDLTSELEKRNKSFFSIHSLPKLCEGLPRGLPFTVQTNKPYWYGTAVQM